MFSRRKRLNMKAFGNRIFESRAEVCQDGDNSASPESRPAVHGKQLEPIVAVPWLMKRDMKILACVDLSDSTEIVVQKTEELAKQISGRVWLLHNAIPEPDKLEFKVDPIAAREALAKRFHVEHRQIQRLAERLRKRGIDSTALLVHGPTVETILKEASDLDVDMIVVGSHGRGTMFQLLVGSVSEGVLHKSRLPVLVIPTHRGR